MLNVADNSDCTLHMYDQFGYWDKRIWMGFGQTLSLTPDNTSLVPLKIFAGFNDIGIGFTVLLWVKDVIVFGGGEIFVLVR